MPRNIAPMIGKRFGRLTVIKRVYAPQYYAQQSVWYLCRCDCGAEKEINGMSLRNGNTKSCGCLRKELNRQRIKERQRKKEEQK